MLQCKLMQARESHVELQILIRVFYARNSALQTWRWPKIPLYAFNQQVRIRTVLSAF